MQRLLILRHATAAAQGAEPGDRVRPLTPAGRAEAERLLPWLRERSLVPDTVLCSPSLRTRETWDVLTALAYDADVSFPGPIYLGSSETYWQAAHDAKGDTVLIVGHNPTCAAMAAELPAAEGAEGRFSGRYPPASLCVAELANGRWAATAVVHASSLPDVER